MGRKNVLWITLESTRADHTSVNGYDRDTTPNLRRIAERPTARSFDRCFSHGIWTRSVSASILTGTYPTHHGAGMTNKSIPDSLATVPELLGAVGYQTVGISPNANLSEATGLDRGFDDFVWIDKSRLVENVGVRTLAKYALNLRRHGGGLTLDTRKHNTGYMETDVAKRWLRHNGGDDDPFFMYLHCGVPHHPYYPPRPDLLEEAARHDVDPETAGELALSHHADLDEHVASGLPYSGEEWELLTGLYDASIEYADRLVGHLASYLERQGLTDTVLVVTADHGELLGEKGLLGHKVGVHDAVSHVPMVVDGLDAALDYRGEIVQHVDVMGTLLDAAGADTSQFQGVDLRSGERSHAVIQRGGERCRRVLDQCLDHDPGFDADRYHQSTLTALRTQSFKYLHSDDRTELFAPPDEETDVSDEFPAVAEDLQTAVITFLDGDGAPLDEGHEDDALSEAARDQLADMGYLVE
ncbi:sulfatase [Halosimplex pelagicum]|uniref:Sulfatase n=1 Tax=Halosimplex pelagicum TaxID=869886 RepID=A0A7D5T414_9EURY|nr:sulfatase [Halosimplex pelagicum]QLH81188.1 sulfatase [Halosimplex pelagicum]